MPPYITYGKVEYSIEILEYIEYRSKCSHRLCPHSLELPFVDWSNKGGTKNVLSEKKAIFQVYFCFATIPRLEINIQWKVRSNSLILDPNLVQIFSYPGIILLKTEIYKLPEMTYFENILWCQIQTTSRRICKICMKLWNFVPKCINFRTASSCLIKISPYFNSQPD